MLTAIVLGIAEGARHSLEPDHLAAVSVLIGDSRSARKSAWFGAVWGLGHTLSLIAMSIMLVGFETALPDAADRVFTLIVAAILIVLGLRSLWTTPHQHSGQKVRSPLQALLVGMVHGLAGSSALTAMVFATLPSSSARLIFIIVFGLGSIVGMAAVSGAAGAWLQRVERPWLMTALRIVIGTASIAIGVMTAVDAIRS
ncbi:MAG: HupE/UreJ family protein [Deltaproteobacteria bacterium]|nr:HupE/UreJ family protein [Nannocystaceae bacterium]